MLKNNGLNLKHCKNKYTTLLLEITYDYDQINFIYIKYTGMIIFTTTKQNIYRLFSHKKIIKKNFIKLFLTFIKQNLIFERKNFKLGQ